MVKNNQIKIATPIPLALSFVTMEPRKANEVNINVSKIPANRKMNPVASGVKSNIGKPIPVNHTRDFFSSKCMNTSSSEGTISSIPFTCSKPF